MNQSNGQLTIVAPNPVIPALLARVRVVPLLAALVVALLLALVAVLAAPATASATAISGAQVVHGDGDTPWDP
jgi:hypothetical protein